MVLAGVGDRGVISYKRSRRGGAEIDRAVSLVLRSSGAEHRMLDFSPYGYDERQFCSPGFDLPVGRFSRSEYATYPEYHTSADDLDLVSAASLADSHDTLLRVLAVLEGNETLMNQCPHGEPQLGRRGLYAAAEERMASLWVLNLSDGRHSLLDIAERSGLTFEAVRDAATRLSGAGLLAGC
jgi:aminopeptidase-like protein